MAYYSRPEEVLKRFKEIFDANQSRLGFQYIAIQDESLIPEYPCLRIISGPLLREVHGTQKYLLTFEVSFWIHHANYESTHAVRSVEDMEIAARVVRFLHQSDIRVLEDPTETGPNKQKIMFGFVTQEIPGTIARPDRSGVVVTRLVWNGQSEVNFDDA